MRVGDLVRVQRINFLLFLLNFMLALLQQIFLTSKQLL
jgi:hypothetical protein